MPPVGCAASGGHSALWNSVFSYFYSPPRAVTVAQEMAWESAGCRGLGALASQTTSQLRINSTLPNSQLENVTGNGHSRPSRGTHLSWGGQRSTGAPHTALPDHPEAGPQTAECSPSRGPPRPRAGDCAGNTKHTLYACDGS